jgi:hypothetical protein
VRGADAKQTRGLSHFWMVATGLLQSTSKHHRKLPEQRRDRPDIPRLPLKTGP